MKKELFNELLQSVQEAAAIERGAAKPSRTFEINTANDVVRVRTKLGLPHTNTGGCASQIAKGWHKRDRNYRKSSAVILAGCLRFG